MGRALFENSAFYLLVFTILLSVALFGTVDSWARSLTIGLICLCALLRFAHQFAEQKTLSLARGSFALIAPLAGILILAAVQMFPLTGGGEKLVPISVDPYATSGFILIFAALLIGFEILLFYTNTRNRLKVLVLAVIVIGAGSAAFGISREFWINNGFLSEYFRGGTGFAQFINSNHFVFLMEMTLGLLCGLTLKGKLSEGHKFIVWVLCAFLIFVSITVNSRGGLMSLAGMFILAFVLHIFTKRSGISRATSGWKKNFLRSRCVALAKAVALSLLIFGIAVVMIAFVGGDRVVHRIEKIEREVRISEDADVSRRKIWQTTLRLIEEKPLLGSGFGAYDLAIKRFDDSQGSSDLRQAHNDYLEILANGGVAALLLVLIFGILVTVKILRRLRGRGGFEVGSCFGATLGIVGVLIHSSVDFGLHALGNALLFLVLVVIATVDTGNFESGNSIRE